MLFSSVGFIIIISSTFFLQPDINDLIERQCMADDEIQELKHEIKEVLNQTESIKSILDIFAKKMDITINDDD